MVEVWCLRAIAKDRQTLWTCSSEKWCTHANARSTFKWRWQCYLRQKRSQTNGYHVFMSSGSSLPLLLYSNSSIQSCNCAIFLFGVVFYSVCVVSFFACRDWRQKWIQRGRRCGEAQKKSIEKLLSLLPPGMFCYYFFHLLVLAFSLGTFISIFFLCSSFTFRFSYIFSLSLSLSRLYSFVWISRCSARNSRNKNGYRCCCCCSIVFFHIHSAIGRFAFMLCALCRRRPFSVRFSSLSRCSWHPHTTHSH